MARTKLDVAVEVEGLKPFVKELKALGDADLSAEFKDANVAVADLIVERARARAAGEGRQAKAAAKTLRAVKSKVRAEVVMGGTKAPWVYGAEFGSYQDKPRRRTTGTYRGFKQFKPWRGSGENAGWFLYPAIRASTDDVVDLYGDRLDELVAKAFPDKGA